MSCRSLPHYRPGHGWMLGVALHCTLTSTRPAFRGFTRVRCCSLPPASSPHPLTRSVNPHRDCVYCRPYNTPSHLQLGVPQTHRPASGKQSRNSFQNFQHLFTRSYKLTVCTSAPTVWLPNNMCARSIPIKRICASRQSTQPRTPNHLIHTFGQDMPSRSPHRSDSVRTGAYRSLGTHTPSPP